MLENERVDTRPTGATNGTEEQGKLFEVARFPEQECYRIVSLRELKVESEQDLEDYYRLLVHPDNREHFSNPPVDASDLKRKLARDHTHAYLAINQEGTVVGAGGINDAPESEHDHFLVKVVVHPDYKGRGMGKQLVSELTDIAFLTPAVTFDSITRRRIQRERIKLDAAVIRDVEGWDKMPRILRSLGFRFVHLLPNQVTVKEQSSGVEVLKPTERYEISREDWQTRKALRDQANNQ